MTKERIMEIADKQMKLGGYDALSFREIAEELNVSKANIHHHFKNKLSLALEVTNHYANQHFDEMSEMVLSHGPNFINVVKDCEEMFWRESVEIGSCSVCVCSQLVRESGIPQELTVLAQAHFDKVQSLFAGAAQKGVESGVLKPHLDAAKVATQFSIIIFGIQSLSQAMPSVKEAKELLFGHAQDWAKGLLA